MIYCGMLPICHYFNFARVHYNSIHGDHMPQELHFLQPKLTLAEFYI